jgi:hypothetical protein
MKKTVKKIVDEFDFSKMRADPRGEVEPITFWVPCEYKAKYDLLQAKSGRKFGKLLKEVVKSSIDKVKIPQ